MDISIKQEVINVTTEEIMLRASAEPIICNILNGLKIGNDCSIRNSIELGNRFAQNTIQHRFFCFLKNIFKAPSYYGSIVKFAAKNIDENILKTLALNIGISSVQCTESENNDNKRKIIQEVCLSDHKNESDIQQKIQTFKRAGTCIFILGDIQNTKELLNCINVAKKHSSNIFIFKCCIDSIGKHSLEQIKACRNVIMAIKQTENNKKTDLFLNLKEYNLLFGYYKNYENVNNSTKEKLCVLENMELGCCFGIYSSKVPQNNNNLLKELKTCSSLPILLDDYMLLQTKFEKTYAQN